MHLWLFETNTLFAMRADAVAVVNGKSVDARKDALEIYRLINTELESRGALSHEWSHINITKS